MLYKCPMTTEVDEENVPKLSRDSSRSTGEK
jgi:hypothetical protein